MYVNFFVKVCYIRCDYLAVSITCIMKFLLGLAFFEQSKLKFSRFYYN